MPDWKDHIRQRLAHLSLDGAREADIVEEITLFLDDCYAEARSAGAARSHSRPRDCSPSRIGKFH